MQCPCRLNEKQLQENFAYFKCCQPFHSKQTKPKTAEQLMRSRYSAFVLQLMNYIVQTTVPAQQKLLDQAAILAWSQQTKWDGLDVIAHEKLAKHHAQVEFKAYFISANERKFHHELSTFVYIHSDWYFLDPTVEMKCTLKQPCLCDSGKKFKHCCAPYLMS